LHGPGIRQRAAAVFAHTQLQIDLLQKMFVGDLRIDMKTGTTSFTSRRFTTFSFSLAAVVMLISGLFPASSQAQNAPAIAAPVTRITAPIDDHKLVTLHGNVPLVAQPKYDKGAVPPSTPVDRMLLVIKRSPAQEADFKQLISDLHNKKSASYHKWLTPEQFGKRFGPSDSDVAGLTAWLQQHGFTVNKISAGKGVIDFSGNAGQLKSTFHTELHSYSRNGVNFYSNNKDPQIPEALKTLVGGFASLNNFKPKTDLQVLGKAAFTTKTHATKPLWSYPADNEGDVYLAVAPGDFAVQYNINPVYSSGNTGAGTTIGIISASNVDNAIVGNYRSLFGFSSSVPVVIVDGNDPGQNGAATEAYLDVEASGSVAPGAQVNLYVGADTNTTSGLYMAMIRAVDDNVADVLSLSYGTCEQELGSSGNEFFEAVWGQAAAQGQTAFVSAGDGGSAGCDDFDSEAQATLGLAVSGFSSTPYNVSVGGTDFYYTSSGQVATYWDLTGTTTPATSLLSTIPEQPWNNAFGLNVGEGVDPYTIVAGSGGASSCATGVDDPNTGEFDTCTAGYPKPSWQVAAGVPNDGVRDIPDVSLFAANGANFSFWPICTATTDCQAALYTGSDCENVPAGDGTVCITGVGGTSASSPAMAGVMALIDASQSSRQGLANYELYPIAGSAPTAFNDVTVGSNNVPCVQGTPDCSLDTNGDGYYTLQNYYSTAGYDEASGLGSVNVANLIANWGSVSFASTETSLALSETTFTHGTPITVTAAVTSGSGTPTGPLALITNSTLPGQIGLGAATLANDGTVNSTVNFFPGGTYSVVAQYGGDGTFGASTSAATTVTVSPENSAAVLNGYYYDTSYNFFPITNGISVQYGSYYYIDTDVYSAAGSPTTNDGFPTGNVTYKNNGATLGTVNLNSNGVAEWATGTLGIGANKIVASFGGDASFNASKTAPLTINVIAGTPYLYLEDLFTTPTGIVAGQPFVVPVLVESVGGVAPTGTVSVTFNGVTSVATLSATSYYGSALATGTVTFTNTSAGTYTLSATYNGDTNFNSALANPQTVVASADNLLASTTTLTSTGTSVGADGALRMNVAVGGNGTTTPTGFVYLLLNGLAFFGAQLDSSGSAALLVPGADILSGNNQVTAQYFGDTNYNGSISAALSITGNSGDFSLTTSNPVLVVASGSTGSTSVSVGSQTGMTGTVSVACAVSDPSLVCTVQNSQLSLPADPSKFATSNIIINTQREVISSSASVGKTANNSKHGKLAGWLAGGSGLTLAVLFLGFPARRRTWGTLFCLVLMAGIGFGSVGCGGNVKPLPPPTYTDAAPGNYNVTITAKGPTAGGGELAVTHTLALQVVVTGGAQ
jgi:hypothetical protein